MKTKEILSLLTYYLVRLSFLKRIIQKGLLNFVCNKIDRSWSKFHIHQTYLYTVYSKCLIALTFSSLILSCFYFSNLVLARLTIVTLSNTIKFRLNAIGYFDHEGLNQQFSQRFLLALNCPFHPKENEREVPEAPYKEQKGRQRLFFPYSLDITRTS